MFEVPEVDFLLVRCISIVSPVLLCSSCSVSKVLQKKIALLHDEEPDACVNYSFGVPDVKIHPVLHTISSKF
jgi:hypothetical protein